MKSYKNKDKVDQYKSGKVKLFGFFVGANNENFWWKSQS